MDAEMVGADRIAKGLWWRSAWSLVGGCTPVSAGCRGCWSARETHMRAKNPNPKVRARCEGLTTTEGKWNGKIRLLEDNLEKPLRRRKPTVWAVWNDLFHPSVPPEFIAQALNVTCDERATDHRFFILTKRPENILKWLTWADDNLGGDSPYSVTMEVHGRLPNIIWGTTAENQRRADERIPLLLQIPGAAHFVSAEPLLGEIDFTGWLYDFRKEEPPEGVAPIATPPLSWIVCGGESEPHARPTHPAWVRRIRDDCQAAGVPWFWKQWGEWGPVTYYSCRGIDHPTLPTYETDAHEIVALPDEKFLPGVHLGRVGKKAAGRVLDGRTWDEFPQ